MFKETEMVASLFGRHGRRSSSTGPEHKRKDTHLNKFMIAAFVAATVAAPALAADKNAKETNVFVEKARKIVKGEKQITAVREDGRQTAMVTISKDGKVTGTVDGKVVNVVFRED
jgi:hypothetical protein